MTKKILFFTAGPVPTVDEQAQIDALNAMHAVGFNVGVRNTLSSGLYGYGIEASDFVAGTIPTAYNAVSNYGVAHASRPCKISLLPAAPSVAALATQQMQVLKATGNDVTALTLADVTATSTTYASGTPATATVHASTGVVTGVAAGTTVITATHTYTSGKTITATATVTVPA